jgi:phenylacetate-CoA ligase
LPVNTYWNEKIETMPVQQLRETQRKRLQQVVKYCYRNMPFYRRRLKEQGVEPGDIKTLADLQKIPFTVKGDLISNYPFGLLAVNRKDIIEIHASSGTTGNPTIGAYTRNDVDVWQELMARSIYTAGGRKGDVLHNAYGYGLFTGGLGFHYGGLKIGMTVTPVSGGMTKRQIKLIQDLGATILCCTPSFAAYLAGYMKKEGVDPKEDTSLRMGMFGAEPWSEELRKRIEDDLPIEAFDVYGLTELCGPGVSVECNEHQGLHVWEDHFIVEVIDPDTGEPLSPGEVGELVFTTLTKDGLPLLRYRTRDISVIEVDKCACGRTHSRMIRIRGRSDDMLIVKGVNLFPSQIEHVLMSFPELASQYQIILDRVGIDVLTIKAELTEKAFKDQQYDSLQLKNRIEGEIRNIVGIGANIDIVEPDAIERTTGKAKRVIDLREGKM